MKKDSPRTPKRREILNRAAYFLDDGADCNFNGGTVRGKWVKGDPYSEDLKREHDEMRLLAKQLRAMAKKEKA